MKRQKNRDQRSKGNQTRGVAQNAAPMADDFSDVFGCEYEPFWIPAIFAMEQSKTADEFYDRLSILVLQTATFSDEERRYLSRIVARPWKKERGAPQKAQRLREVFWNYYAGYLSREIDPPKRAAAIRAIAVEYGMTDLAAGKLYDQAIKHNGEPIPRDLETPRKK